MRDLIQKQLRESAEVKIKTSELLTEKIIQAAEMLLHAYRNGGKVLLVGNGGSAADAQHIAGELVANLDHRRKRKALPAIALTANTSILTAIGNDHGYDQVFARNVEAFAGASDVLIAITTSGNSSNVLRAAEAAKKNGAKVVGLTGGTGGKLIVLSDLALVVPSSDTQRIQETHITIGHILCDIIEQAYVEEETRQV